MADKTETVVLNKSGAGNETVTRKWIDQGDGTHAEKVAAELVLGDVVIGEVDQGAAGAEEWLMSLPSLLIPDTFKTLKAVAIGSIATVWTPASGKKVRLMGGSISVSADVSVLFEDNSAGTDVYQTPVLTADTPYSFDLGNGVLLSAINRVLKATSSGAANITGTLYGREE